MVHTNDKNPNVSRSSTKTGVRRPGKHQGTETAPQSRTTRKPWVRKIPQQGEEVTRTRDAGKVRNHAPGGEKGVSKLQVHQVELEVQNRALRKSRIAVEEARDRFAELYEFAPVGYLTLSKNGIIIEANLTVAAILGVERTRLLRSRLTKFIAADNLGRWNQYRILVNRSTDKHVCELNLMTRQGTGIVARIESIRMGRQGTEEVILVAVSDITDRVRAEENLALRNRDLEELRTAYQTIADGQRQLRRNQKELTEALEEKEALLSEIHHRVKNNLTAFISLLSLDGAQEEPESTRALRKDLQNRARSMALIHETLYRTGKFSSVDMGIYLRTLVEQVASSYSMNGSIRTVVSAHDVPLDLSRATTAGLIVNELVTNSFKYAFPPGFDCRAERGGPCTIRVSATCDNGSYLLRVADNGIGLPAGFDPVGTRSLGLKLVNFLARHQLRAETTFTTGKGTEFIFTLHQQENCS